MNFDQQGTFSKYIHFAFLKLQLPVVLMTAFQNFYFIPFDIKYHTVGSIAHPYTVLKLFCTY